MPLAYAASFPSQLLSMDINEAQVKKKVISKHLNLQQRNDLSLSRNSSMNISTSLRKENTAEHVIDVSMNESFHSTSSQPEALKEKTYL